MSRLKIYDRFTWDELVALYPQKWLGLSEIIWDGDSIVSAVIKYKEKTPRELEKLCIQGDIEAPVLVMPGGMCIIGRNDIRKSRK